MNIIEGNDFPITGFTVLGRIDCQSPNNKNGIIVYKKAELTEDIIWEKLEDNDINNCVLQLFYFKFKERHHIIVYKSPEYPIQEFMDSLLNHIRRLYIDPNQNFILIGDINICRLMGPPQLETLLETFGLRSLLERKCVTRYYSGTHIDWAFSNLSLRAVTYETILSDHDGIFIYPPGPLN